VDVIAFFSKGLFCTQEFLYVDSNGELDAYNNHGLSYHGRSLGIETLFPFFNDQERGRRPFKEKPYISAVEIMSFFGSVEAITESLLVFRSNKELERSNRREKEHC
jgi:hypothetical protein